MNGRITLIILAWFAISLTGCQTHLDMQYTPEQYAKLRGIELITTPPSRSFELVANVQGSGGRHTATSTMINGMIDEAHKVGARALIPMEFASEGRGAIKGLDLFAYTENDRTVTKGRAIRWTGN